MCFCVSLLINHVASVVFGLQPSQRARGALTDMKLRSFFFCLQIKVKRCKTGRPAISDWSDWALNNDWALDGFTQPRARLFKAEPPERGGRTQKLQTS